MSKLFNKVAAKRIALSGLKAFAAAAGAVVVAHQADLIGGGSSALKAVAFSALVAGGDAAAKVVQISLEG